jgi:sugar phosphate isomerase/epimerase
MNRRDFVRNTAVGLTAAAVLSRLPVSLLASPYGKPIGLQLYTLRDQLEKDVAGTIKQLAAIGYKDVEIYSLYGKSPSEFVKLLKDNGMTASSGHYLLPMVKDEWDKRIEDAKTLGLQYMVIAILEPEVRKSLDDYKKLAELFNKAGEATKKAGIQF